MYKRQGGWGDPKERDPESVLDDVLNEKVSVAGAKDDYAVVIDGSTWTVDVDATKKLRS